MSGAFIVFEGPDGSGTTLHTSLLVQSLRHDGLTVVETAEPTDGPIGSTIRQKLRNGDKFEPRELQQHFSDDRAWHLESIISPALSAGSVVISDRYSPSTIVYGQALGVGVMELERMNKNFIQPDLLFLLLPPFEICKMRILKRSETDVLEDISFQKTVHDLYHIYAQTHPECVVVDTSGEKDDVSARILNAVYERLPKEKLASV